jgi:SAM-dependent methyltransferase
MKNYEDIFAVRGSRYDVAMQNYPNARNEEFAQVIDSLKITSGMVIADIPAGGGYLKAYLPKTIKYLPYDPCKSFNNHHQVTHKTSLLPLPWPNESVDIAISLAGIHHLNEKKSFFSELYRITKPTGRIILSDVAHGSKPAKFLDGFVDLHNGTGHQGTYFDESSIKELAGIGWIINSNQINEFHWKFANRKDMVNFCHDLFDIHKSSSENTLISIESELGTTDFSDGSVGMKWSLLTIEASKNS